MTYMIYNNISIFFILLSGIFSECKLFLNFNPHFRLKVSPLHARNSCLKYDKIIYWLNLFLINILIEALKIGDHRLNINYNLIYVHTFCFISHIPGQYLPPRRLLVEIPNQTMFKNNHFDYLNV